MYVTLMDLEDDLLKDSVTQDDLDAANRYVDKVVKSFGIDPGQVPSVVPDELKNIASYFAYERRACFMSGDATRPLADGTDVYELKRRIYAKKLEAALSALTTEDILGEDPLDKGSGITIELSRG